MKRILRYGLIVLGLVIVALIAIPFFVDVNTFRPTVESRLSAVLGRQVSIGNLDLALLQGSLSAESLSVADDPQFSTSPFLTAQSLRIGVELWPLIRNRSLNVTGLTIENPEIRLIRNASGQWNYSSLGGQQSGAPAATAGSDTPQQSPAGAPQPPPDQPSAAAAPLDARIRQFSIQGGRVIIGSTESKQQNVYDDANVTASDVALTSRFPVTVSANLPGGGNFSLEGAVGPVNQTDASLTPFDAKMTARSLDLARTGVLDPALGLGGLIDLDATLASQDAQASTQGQATLTKALLVAGGSAATIPVVTDFSTRYDLRRSGGTLNPSTIKIGNASARLSGTYQTAPDDTTRVNLKIEGQNMPATDLQAFLPALGINLPTGASLTAGNLQANLTVQGPTNRLVTTGNVGLMSATLTGFNLGEKLSSVAQLAGVSNTGSDLGIERLTMNLRMAPDGLRLDQFLTVITRLGSIAGGGTIDAKNNLDLKMAATLSGVPGATLETGISGAISRLTRTTGGGCKTATIPFQVQGTTANPRFIPDVGGAAASMLQSYIRGCPGEQTTGNTAAPSSGSGSGSGAAAPAPSNPLERLTDIFRRKQ
jgi:AsmA protein